MKKTLDKMIHGYNAFRKKYASGNQSIMQQLASHGQHPEVMVVSCCDSRVDPALILQCDPGDLFITRNVANIVPPYELENDSHRGTSTALEFGVCYLNVKHLIILGHSQCGGIAALKNKNELKQNDFISNWVSLIDNKQTINNIDAYAKKALKQSYENCLTFPWIKERVLAEKLSIHLWFFAIESGEIFTYTLSQDQFVPLVDQG